mmetsp:Transcript_53825/g.95960  ORF Transcript_53825/g.95960 Transcript_53825/m.95960 type:complete len:195 (+) Transcript_53825:1392-1976(+)
MQGGTRGIIRRVGPPRPPAPHTIPARECGWGWPKGSGPATGAVGLPHCSTAPFTALWHQCQPIASGLVGCHVSVGANTFLIGPLPVQILTRIAVPSFFGTRTGVTAKQMRPTTTGSGFRILELGVRHVDGHSWFSQLVFGCWLGMVVTSWACQPSRHGSLSTPTQNPTGIFNTIPLNGGEYISAFGLALMQCFK